MLSDFSNWPMRPIPAATASAKGKAKSEPATEAPKAKLGALPEWDLAERATDTKSTEGVPA